MVLPTQGMVLTFQVCGAGQFLIQTQIPGVRVKVTWDFELLLIGKENMSAVKNYHPLQILCFRTILRNIYCARNRISSLGEVPQIFN